MAPVPPRVSTTARAISWPRAASASSMVATNEPRSGVSRPGYIWETSRMRTRGAYVEQSGDAADDRAAGAGFGRPRVHPRDDEVDDEVRDDDHEPDHEHDAENHG